ncbi:hypothetical protein KUTeg_002321 [Tegillarca granosa]|uniref:alkaline phosphatase n=1 Tax=Tegillarca granosa TaxID=220873 RepID=A0ABQ9FTZ5_TEGGR|nr:hypothetical protein KUTeg_002321 [Tegillarca granosa]
MAADGKPFTTLLYANGPGGINGADRENLTGVNTDNDNLVFQAAVPLDSETHGGEDVAIYARGPMSHLFQGVKEQHYVAHVMAYASCVGEYRQNKDCAASLLGKQNTCNTSKGIVMKGSYFKYMLLFFAFLFGFDNIYIFHFNYLSSFLLEKTCKR